METRVSELDHAEQIEYWEEKLEELKSGYEKMFSGTNEVYETQLEELCAVTNQKMQGLQKWREDKLASIHNEKEKKVSLLQTECERHKADIPKLLQRSIRQQFDQLQREFPDVFSHFLNEEIPFVQEFAQQRFSRVLTVDLDHPLLSQQEIGRDFEKASHPTFTYSVRGNELVSSIGTIRSGDSVVLRFGRMHPIIAEIEDIDSESVNVRPKGGAKSIAIALQALEMNIVTITRE
jgi:hypothetical protein